MDKFSAFLGLLAVLAVFVVGGFFGLHLYNDHIEETQQQIEQMEHREWHQRYNHTNLDCPFSNCLEFQK